MLFQQHSGLFVAANIIQAYRNLRNDQIYDVWNTVYTDYGYTILCRLYYNRIFEIWTIS